MQMRTSTWVCNCVTALVLALSFAAPACALTSEQMQEAVRYYLEEESAYNFTSAEITFFLNRAQDALPSIVADDAFVDLTTITTSSVTLDTYNQTAPTDYLRIKHVFLNGYRCQKKHIDEVWALDPLNPAGEKPKATAPWYVVFSDSLRIYPLQTTAGTYEVWYYKRPTVLAADDQECDLAPELEHYVIMLASIYALKKDHEFQKADALLAQFQLEVGAFNTKITGVHGLQPKPTPGAQ